MNRTHLQDREADTEALELRQANAEAKTLLRNVLLELRTLLGEDYLRDETPIEVWMPLESVVDAIDLALQRLDAPRRVHQAQLAHTTDHPTSRQGQFLAYINEYIRRNSAGLAPTHAVLQRVFGLTPPSVNSMLRRLEQRGFIRRTPGVARGIELTIDPDLIPPLEQRFRF